MKPEKRVILIIRDGWGYSPKKKGNAVYAANLEHDNFCLKNYPYTILKCSGNAVGIPEGTQGGSEPGHLTIGAGRVVWQPLEDINRKIKSGEFFKNKVLLDAMRNCRKKKSKLHLMGLFSDQGIHGTTYHLYALLRMAKQQKLKDVFIHCFLDGRDVPERSAEKYLKECQKQIRKIGVGKISSLVGRYYAMDRDHNWDRTKEAYDLLTLGKGFRESSPITALKNAYSRGGKTDYYVKPISLASATIDNNDSVIFWNFRSDRTRQLTEALTQRNFNKFQRTKIPKIHFICMSEYDPKFMLPVAFYQQKIKNNLGQVISKAGLKQLRIAETEKYAHVTFFFNSQVEKPSKNEDRIMVHSPKVPSYDLKPEMSAYEITEKLIPEIGKEKYDFIVVNFANGDLVGHSGKFDAVVKACKVVDECIGRIVENGLEKNYITIITGDHGNAEEMLYPNGEINPSHGTNPVPFILITNDETLKNSKLKKGLGLSSIAPTILRLMGVDKPKEMTAQALL
ncbi:MAG TPA: 2,3-bisphosphoglycerate-independent phosphoglycerate mutase [Candidatus Nanoarchaeia archaeon]|nr:2,3-bisphosphoglycerate-independent phosphoglycerate mutase [Candidatus Nanoarchaeia archaeon]